MRSDPDLATWPDLKGPSLAFADALRPPPDITVSEWADSRRVMGRNSPEPGPWRTDRVPYVREIQDNLSAHSGVEQVVLVKAAQGAGTEFLLNGLGYRMDSVGGNCLVVMPTVGVAKKFSRTRLSPMIELSPALREKVAPLRSRNGSNTILLKEYDGGTLLLAGANSASGLRSDPIPFLEMDEEDAYKQDLEDEGHPGELAIQRTATFRDRKIARVSTPTIEGYSHIWKAFLAGDQRYFHIPCPLCGAMQRLVWSHKDGRSGGLKWPKGKPEEARYQCEHCEGLWEEWRKTDALLEGRWIPEKPENGGGKIRSYQISALYYPYGWPGSAWPNLAAQWMRDYRDPVKLKTFWNLKLGLPWSDPSEAKVEAQTLFARRETYGPEIPARAVKLTAGVDVQANRLEAEVAAWGPNEENWSIEYRVFPGDTSKLESDKSKNEIETPWELLETWLKSEWLSEYDVTLGISATGVDSSYNTQKVTQWCGERAHLNIYAVKGKEGAARPIYTQKARRQRGKWPPPHIIGVDTAKEDIYSSLKVLQPGPRFCHFPLAPEYELSYFEMLTAEVRLPDYSGPTPKFVWKKKTPGARNEALDCRVYALWALIFLRQTRGLDLAREAQRLDEMARARAEREQRAGVTGVQEQNKTRDFKDLLRPIAMKDDI